MGKQTIENEKLSINTIHASIPHFPHCITIGNKDLPTVFSYRGDLSLLHNTKNNIAVVGVLTPTNNIIERERRIIRALADRKLTIISGLALGCDTIAHETAIECGAKTIAFLPSTLENIYPKVNRVLAEKIVESGGLIISEYTAEPKSRGEAIGRFIKRDRLQAMYASAVILIASYRKGVGDSGSRHCVQKAKAYGKERFVMFNSETDATQDIFGLNIDLISEGVLPISKDIIENL